MHRIIKRGFKTAVNHCQRLKITPICSHTMNKVNITGDGFQPDAPLTIQSSLFCPEERFDFLSYARVFCLFYADKELYNFCEKKKNFNKP